MATRRDVLRSSAAIAVSAASGARAFAAADEPPRLASAVRSGAADLAGVWREGEVATAAIPSRGHGMARLYEDGRMILMGRRPGVAAAILDLGDLTRPAAVVRPAAGFRFAGHAAAAAGSGGFVSSEFEAQTAQALLVRRDAAGNELDRWAVAGLEPHEILFARGGARLIVALGGLIEDGGVAGPAVNPGGIDSALLEIDPHSGRELARHRLVPELASLSLRHLALAPDGATVAVGMQDQDLSRPRPLVAVLIPGQGLAPAPLPDPDELDFKGYIGSIAVDAGGAYVAATSPRAGAAGLWSLRDLRWLGGLRLADACGLAAGPAPGEFWLSTGLGDVFRLAATSGGLTVTAQWRSAVAFDNHLLRI